MPAQSQFQYRQHLTRNNGLPNDEVNVITQDAEGFIWIGTRGGLARYDGAQMKVFQHDPEDSTSLADEWISDLEPMDSTLWVGTVRGISVLDLHTEKFTNYYLDKDGNQVDSYDELGGGASLIHRDRLGAIWIGGRESRNFGWCRYHPAQDSFSCFSLDPGALEYDIPSPSRVNNVLCVHRDNVYDSILWVGTMSGLFQQDLRTGAVRHYYYPQEPRSFEVAVNVFRRIWQGPDRKLYCGSWSGGLNIFDPVTGEYYPAPYSNTDMPDVFFQSIREISQKSETEIWVTLFKSLVAYDFVDHRITLRMESDFASDEMYGADYIDRDGRIWARLHGLHIFDPTLQQFQYAPYQALNLSGEGFTYDVVHDRARNRLTVISRDCDGLYHYSLTDHTWEKTPFTSNILTVRRFEGNNGIMIDADEMIISASHEVFRYLPERDQMELLDIRFPVRVKAFRDIFSDRNGKIWLGTENDGVIRWDPRTNALRPYVSELGMDSIRTGAAVLHADRQNNIWLRSFPHLFVYRQEGDDMVDLCMDADICNVLEVDEDPQGRMWLRKAGGEIIIARPEGKSWSVDTVLHLGTRRSPVSSIHADNKGNMWGFSRDQILRIDPATLTYTPFSTRYFRDFHEISSIHLIDSSTLVLGLANALILIDLPKLQQNAEEPVPYISTIEVRDKPYQMEIVPRKLESLTLRHHENFFSISFSALGFTLSEQNRFEYRLRNFQDTWSTAEGRRFANYTNVPSGKYVFELRVFNSEGNLSPKTVSLPITVKRHWTEMWRFRALSVVLFLALVYALYKYRVGQIRKEEKLKRDYKSKLADMEMTALRAQMNPHFIFNCLNSIESFIVRNDSVKASAYLNDFARLIRLILQNSGSKSIPLKDELEALELYLKMEGLRFSERFEYQINVEDSIDTSYVQIPSLILQPYVENAIWHGLIPKEKIGHLNVSIQLRDNKLHCVIEDDGIGRAAAAERNKSKGMRKSKSMGMTITKNRIELLNEMYHTNTQIKIIDLVDESAKAIGTRVELMIPV